MFTGNSKIDDRLDSLLFEQGEVLDFRLSSCQNSSFTRRKFRIEPVVSWGVLEKPESKILDISRTTLIHLKASECREDSTEGNEGDYEDRERDTIYLYFPSFPLPPLFRFLVCRTMQQLLEAPPRQELQSCSAPVEI